MSALADRLRAALAAGHSRAPALLAGDSHHESLAEAVTPAAVLVAITDRLEPGVLLTRRTETMRRHAGQVAFPGGRIDPGEDAIAAALREAEEEIALPPDAVNVVGVTDSYRTITGYEVTPVIGVVPPDLPLRANADEVADWFEAPLAFLVAPDNHRERTVDWQGRERRYVELLWEERRIWGATAAMIVNLSRRLAWPG